MDKNSKHNNGRQIMFNNLCSIILFNIGANKYIGTKAHKNQAPFPSVK